MSRLQQRTYPLLALSCALGLAGVGPASAGTFIDFGQNNAALVTHPEGYTGAPGEFTVGLCLDPTALPESGDPEQAMRNVAATYNRQEAKSPNLVNNNAGKVDFESVLLHEVGHCLGMDHNTLGPSEVNTGDFSHPSLYYGNTLPGPNATLNVGAGADAVRATRDDVRGDDINRNWFRKGVNNPFEAPPATIDRGTHSVLLSELPGGHDFVEQATSFGPCNGGQPNSSSLRGQPTTQNTMFPVLCTNRFLRELSPDDVTTLRIAQAGRDGAQAVATDNYKPKLEVVPPGPNCDIVVKFVNNAGFAFCQVGGQFLGSDIVISGAEARFQRTVDWHFNPQDTTGGEANPPADLSVSMGADTANAMPGEEVVYTITISNGGPATAMGTTVSTPTPPGLIFVSNSGHCATTFPCNLGDLTSGANRQITSTFRVADDQPGGGVITTTTTAMSGTDDNSMGNNAAMQSLTVWAPQADLSLTLNDGGAQAVRGGTVTYTAALSNAGPSTASALELNFEPPAGTSVSAASGSGWTCTGQGDGSSRCTRASLAAGAQSSVTFTVSVPINYAGSATLSASAEVHSLTLDPVSQPGNSNPDSENTPLSDPNAERVYCNGFEDDDCGP